MNRLRRSMTVHWVACGTCTQKQRALSWVVLNWSVPVIFSSGRSLGPFEGSPRRRASRSPLTNTFTRLILSPHLHIRDPLRKRMRGENHYGVATFGEGKL